MNQQTNKRGKSILQTEVNNLIASLSEIQDVTQTNLRHFKIVNINFVVIV